MKKSNTYWLTLVELLVVITVLSILATLWIIAFRSNLADARDAARSSDLFQITNVLHLYESENGEFPKPSDGVDIMYEDAIAWTQWVFWDSVGLEVKKFWQDTPRDPKYDNFYSYSTTKKWNEFQVASIRETTEDEEWIWDLVTFSQVHADNIELSQVLGNYNGFMLLAQSWATNYFIATPSIIATDISSPDVVDIMSTRKLVYDNFFNLPASYSWYLNLEGWFDFNVTDPLIYSWSIENLKTEDQLLEFYSNLKYIYATSPTESFEKYISLLEQDGITSLKWFLTRNFKIPFRTYFNCKDILDEGLADGSKMYLIDRDGSGPQAEESVYCDMETDGGGWTRIWDNFAVNWDFAWWVWVAGAFEYTNQDNIIVALPEAIDGNNFALNQTGNYSSYYKIPFPDMDILEPWYELRLTLWRSDYSDGSATASNEVNIMWWKYSRWTVWDCTSWGSCYFQNLNRKLLDATNVNFWPWKILSDIEVNVIDHLDSWVDITTNYFKNGVLFDGFIPSSWNTDAYGQRPYSTVEKEAIDDWVQAGWFLISTNNESDYDPLWEYFGMPTIQYSGSPRWVVEDIEHPLINGSVWLWVDLGGKELFWNYARAVLWWQLLPDDTVIARDYYAPYEPTIILRKHGKWLILFMADDGMFMNVSSNEAFQSNDNESVLAAAILAYGIETAAGINPKEWYAFHNRMYYSDGTFSLNGAEEILDSITIDDAGTPRVWVKEQVRHTIFKEPESFDWYLWLDANNNKDLYFTGLQMEVFYR